MDRTKKTRRRTEYFHPAIIIRIAKPAINNIRRLTILIIVFGRYIHNNEINTSVTTTRALCSDEKETIVAAVVIGRNNNCYSGSSSGATGIQSNRS